MEIKKHFLGQVKEYLVLDNTDDQYRLREMVSGQVLHVPSESLRAIKSNLDEAGRVSPGRTLKLFTRWEGRWAVYPLRSRKQEQPIDNGTPLEEDEHLELKAACGLRTFESDVASFANGDGGTLIWGIEPDEKTLKGIENLVAHYKGKDLFTCFLRNRLRQNLNGNLFLSVIFDFKEREGHTLLKITVPKSSSVVLVRDALYVRSGNTTQRLFGDNMIQYIIEKTNKYSKAV